MTESPEPLLSSLLFCLPKALMPGLQEPPHQGRRPDKLEDVNSRSGLTRTPFMNV